MPEFCQLRAYRIVFFFMLRCFIFKSRVNRGIHSGGRTGQRERFPKQRPRDSSNRTWMNAGLKDMRYSRKMMRHTDIRTTMVVDNEMRAATFQGMASGRNERNQSASPAKLLKRWWAL